jgi:hypothetical protein
MGVRMLGEIDHLGQFPTGLCVLSNHTLIVSLKS